MTPEIIAVLLILAVSLVLFVTEKLRMDVVALLVLGTLGVSGLVTLEEALAGFSNPAVVTVWAMFILSAGLSATGVADFIGQRVLRLAGKGEVRMILVIMLTTGVLSAFMNNIGVAALMLPVVMDIARRTGTPPSRLLMPMAYSSLLGGLTTLIGTPPNLVASTALRQAGLEGFELFEFAPIGVPALVGGALFIALVGRHLLPAKMPEGMGGEAAKAGLQFAYGLEERRFGLRIGEGSPLHGRKLRGSGLSATLGLTVLSVRRGHETFGDLGPDFVLESGDILSAQGRIDEFREFLGWQALEMASGDEILQVLSSEKLAVVNATVAPRSELVGLTVEEAGFRARFGAHIVAVRRPGKVIRDDLSKVPLKAGDVLTLDGPREPLGKLGGSEAFSEVQMVSQEHLSDIYPDSDSLIELMLPPDSRLAGMTVARSGLGETLGLRIIGIARRGGSILFPDADEVFEPGDQLLVLGKPEGLELMRAIQSLELLEDDGEGGSMEELGETEGIAEVTFSPRSTLPGRTPKELDFRQRYGLQVLSIWRRGRSWRSHLRHMPLEFGDALLLRGPREQVEKLADDPDFVVLTRMAYGDQARAEPGKAVLSAVLMLAVVGLVLAGVLPIAIAAVAGAAVMLATRCLTMEDAYRAIDWKSVFLIAGMIPLGTAMESSGAAHWIAGGVSGAMEPLGLWGILLGIYLLTAAATTIVPTTALVLIMAPIAIGTSAEMGIDPKLLMMGVAMAASASFTSPISHPANVLVMGPGGYRFVDYVKMGVVLALVVALTVLPLIVWKYG
ncbi:SLC13 family permease [Haloferula sp. A504]|uniref:SLC13 family permease n=1 Tax=Haloferula sp. A504 TaxID=3373601 RepID=UPI0031C801E0|nr:SLC13 family permease [Verrucomicrobiaceae bacterium E54]